MPDKLSAREAGPEKRWRRREVCESSRPRKPRQAWPVCEGGSKPRGPLLTGGPSSPPSPPGRPYCAWGTPKR
eukprot:9610134-Alexandrium_andersonii.AAC.1